MDGLTNRPPRADLAYAPTIPIEPVPREARRPLMLVP